MTSLSFGQASEKSLMLKALTIARYVKVSQRQS